MRTNRSQFAQRVCMAVLAAAAAGLLPFGFAACNTVEGVGEDVSATGQALEDVAEDEP